MKRKLKCIMLIDDNEDDNFFHQRSIRKIDAAEKTVVMQDAGEALEYLRNQSPSNLPELVFLDINMPGMNGWEFIEEYKKLKSITTNTIVIMLSTSQNPDDLIKAKSETSIRDFKTKPLTQDMLEKILTEYL
jgi:CheY-like chemotaxis protein